MKYFLSTIIIISSTLILAPEPGLAQHPSAKSIKLGFGAGMNQGKQEIGIGTFASIELTRLIKKLHSN
jgi:hypothetical protein